MHFSVDSIAVRDLGLREATDREIFAAAKDANTIVMTKDSDFVQLLDRYGSPPQIIWLTCGNTSNERLQEILTQTLQEALDLLSNTEPLVEIGAT